MAVTRSTSADRDRRAPAMHVHAPRVRGRESIGLLGATALVVAALVLAWYGRTARPPTTTEAPLNLSQIEKREQLLPHLNAIAAPAERQYVARKIFERLRDMSGGVPNVGTLAPNPVSLPVGEGEGGPAQPHGSRG